MRGRAAELSHCPGRAAKGIARVVTTLFFVDPRLQVIGQDPALLARIVGGLMPGYPSVGSGGHLNLEEIGRASCRERV